MLERLLACLLPSADVTEGPVQFLTSCLSRQEALLSVRRTQHKKRKTDNFMIRKHLCYSGIDEGSDSEAGEGALLSTWA
jgi:hypothetical protein